jgi:hypothetical protein
MVRLARISCTTRRGIDVWWTGTENPEIHYNVLVASYERYQKSIVQPQGDLSVSRCLRAEKYSDFSTTDADSFTVYDKAQIVILKVIRTFWSFGTNVRASVNGTKHRAAAAHKILTSIRRL